MYFKLEFVCRCETTKNSAELLKRNTHLPDVVQVVYLRGQSAVHAQELLVHQGRQWEAVERFHAGVVHSF